VTPTSICCLVAANRSLYSFSYFSTALALSPLIYTGLFIFCIQDDDTAVSTQKPDFISPLDDLAFDMYQDTEVAQIIRKLEKKKQDSVLGKTLSAVSTYTLSALLCLIVLSLVVVLL